MKPERLTRCHRSLTHTQTQSKDNSYNSSQLHSMSSSLVNLSQLILSLISTSHMHYFTRQLALEVISKISHGMQSNRWHKNAPSRFYWEDYQDNYMQCCKVIITKYNWVSKRKVGNDMPGTWHETLGRPRVTAQTKHITYCLCSSAKLWCSSTEMAQKITETTRSNYQARRSKREERRLLLEYDEHLWVERRCYQQLHQRRLQAAYQRHSDDHDMPNIRIDSSRRVDYDMPNIYTLMTMTCLTYT